MLPRLNELRRLPQILYLVTLTIRHAASQGVRGFGCGLLGPTQRTNAIVDMTFVSGVLTYGQAFFGREGARRVGMVMHATWMINNINERDTCV